ncbi:MAG: membrane-associated protease RseP (regulator of RpoE activity), partial [Saprospiraceae bacterium]
DGKKANETVDVNYTRDGEVNNTTVTLKKSNNIFLFKGEDQEIKWEGNVNDWNFNWLEDNGNASMGVILGEETENGVAIEGTVNNSGAEEAGLKSGDVITAIDAETVKTGTELEAILKEKKAGDNVEVTYLRGEETKTVNITLGSKNFRIRKPRDIDILFGDNNRNEEMEVYEDVEIPKVTAENRLEFTQLDMYPNPNKGTFTLAFEIEPGTAIITIKNVDDEVVYTKDMPNFNGVFSDRIDISEQPSGVYFLTIEQGGKKVIKKVIYD